MDIIDIFAMRLMKAKSIFITMLLTSLMQTSLEITIDLKMYGTPRPETWERTA
jgi:hypothetical protein